MASAQVVSRMQFQRRSAALTSLRIPKNRARPLDHPSGATHARRERMTPTTIPGRASRPRATLAFIRARPDSRDARGLVRNERVVTLDVLALLLTNPLH